MHGHIDDPDEREQRSLWAYQPRNPTAWVAGAFLILLVSFILVLAKQLDAELSNVGPVLLAIVAVDGFSMGMAEHLANARRPWWPDGALTALALVCCALAGLIIVMRYWPPVGSTDLVPHILSLLGVSIPWVLLVVAVRQRMAKCAGAAASPHNRPHPRT